MARRNTKPQEEARQRESDSNARLVAQLEELREELDSNDDVQEWQMGFRVARRMHRWIFDNGKDPRQYSPERYAAAIVKVFDENVFALVLQAWNKIIFAEGYNLMKSVDALISRSPWRAPLPDSFPEHLREKGAILATGIKYLQDVTANDRIFLSARSAGQILRTSHVAAAALLKLLVQHGVIEEVEKARPTERKAATFRYRVNT